MSTPANLRKPAFLEAANAPVAEAPARFAAVSDLRSNSPSSEPKPPPVLVVPPPPVQATPLMALENLGLAVGLLRSQSERFAEQARSDALELGFLVARRILEQELHSDPQALLALIRSAVSRAGSAHQVTLRLNPKDADKLRELSPEEAGMSLSIGKVEIVGDASLTLGDCLVETELGTVDGRLATRLQEMREVVTEALATKQASGKGDRT